MAAIRNRRNLPWKELQAAVDEAAHFGPARGVACALAGGNQKRDSAGVASIEHATMIDDEGIALAKQHGTYLDMDIYDEECIRRREDWGRFPRIFCNTTRSWESCIATISAKAVKAGVKLSFGTDAGVCPYDRSVKQFAFIGAVWNDTNAGDPVGDHERADLLGHADVVGDIKPGKFADVIAVAGDPLQDISVLEHVQL